MWGDPPEPLARVERLEPRIPIAAYTAVGSLQHSAQVGTDVLRQIGLGAAGLGGAPCCPLLVRQGSACH